MDMALIHLQTSPARFVHRFILSAKQHGEKAQVLPCEQISPSPDTTANLGTGSSNGQGPRISTKAQVAPNPGPSFGKYCALGRQAGRSRSSPHPEPQGGNSGDEADHFSTFVHLPITLL